MENKPQGWKKYWPQRLKNLNTEKAIVLDKVIKKGGADVGYCYFPLRLVGKRFIMILVPEEDKVDVNMALNNKKLKI